MSTTLHSKKGRGKNLMTNDEVIRVLKNFLDCMPKTYRRRNDNASVVQDIILFRTRTAGRTSCKELCREIGIDPCGHTLEPFKEGEAR